MSLDAIAQRAGVGPSTLFRRFPTRDDLVEEVLQELFEPIRERAARWNAHPDPGRAFRSTVTDTCALEQEELRAFAELAGSSPRVEARARAMVADLLRPMFDRARAAGLLRPGIAVDDVVTFIRMVESTPASDEQRHLALEVIRGTRRHRPGLSQTIRVPPSTTATVPVT